ncbi:MAG: ATP-binding protein [Magnetospirillum sp. WYHS-4]
MGGKRLDDGDGLADDAAHWRAEAERLRVRVEHMKEIEDRLGETLQNLEIHQEELRTQNEELRESQRVLQDVTRKYYSLFHNSPSGYVVLDSHHRITDVNFAGAGLLGREVAHVVGKPLFLFVAPESRRALEDHLRDAGSGGTPPVEVVLGMAEDQPAVALFETCVLEAEGGEFKRLLVSIVDITARRSAERKLEEAMDQLTRSNQELKQFAFVASHDLQEPLRTVITYLQLLERRYGTSLEDEGRVFLDIAVGGAKRLRALVQDLLAYSRVDTQVAAFDHVRGDQVVTNVLRDLSAAVEEAEARVSFDPLPSWYGDAGQLGQVFANLIGNAIKYRHPERPPQVHLAVEDQGPHWIVTVADNGIGIEPQYYQRIFLVFQRLHTQEQFSGTGIGLAICKKIVERHGGRIWVESTHGEGSRFRFSLPKAPRG